MDSQESQKSPVVLFSRLLFSKPQVSIKCKYLPNDYQCSLSSVSHLSSLPLLDWFLFRCSRRHHHNRLISLSKQNRWTATGELSGPARKGEIKGRERRKMYKEPRELSKQTNKQASSQRWKHAKSNNKNILDIKFSDMWSDIIRESSKDR